MVRRFDGLWLVAALVPLLASADASAQEPKALGIPVARVEYVAGTVKVSPPGEPWAAVAAGAALRTGDAVRTGPDGLARVSFPWMTLTLSPDSVLSTPGSRVLSVTLETGRIRIESQEDIIKVVSGPTEIRGRGMSIVRRRVGQTIVATVAGAFRVTGAGTSVQVEQGHGTVASEGDPPSPPRPLPEPPEIVSPAEDPVYVHAGDPVELSWRPDGAGHQVEVLGVDSDEVLFEAEADESPYTIRLPDLGTYRWRVTSRAADGLESLPSGEGLICVVEDY